MSFTAVPLPAQQESIAEDEMPELEEQLSATAINGNGNGASISSTVHPSSAQANGHSTSNTATSADTNTSNNNDGDFDDHPDFDFGEEPGRCVCLKGNNKIREKISTFIKEYNLAPDDDDGHAHMHLPPLPPMPGGGGGGAGFNNFLNNLANVLGPPMNFTGNVHGGAATFAMPVPFPGAGGQGGHGGHAGHAGVKLGSDWA